MKRNPNGVFVNMPFDTAYAPLASALVFAITACGFQVRCALEEDDSGDIRLDRLVRLIGQCAKSIHDLSRTEVRFNMPFELGLALGCKRFGGRARRADGIKIMVNEPYRLPAYLSDLGGNDPAAHAGQPHAVIEIVRNFLHTKPGGGILPGPASLAEDFDEFGEALPEIAGTIDFRAEEIGVFRNYRTYLWCVSEFLKAQA